MVLVETVLWRTEIPKMKNLRGDCTVEQNVCIVDEHFKTVISDLVAKPGPVLLLYR